MKKMIQRWFSVPEINGDEEKKFRVKLLNGSIIASFVFVLLILIFHLFDGQNLLRKHLVELTITIFFGLSGITIYTVHKITREALQKSQKEIQERKRAETELKKLTWAVEQSPASIVITNLEGIIEYVNPRFSQVTGYSFAEISGKNPRILKTDRTSPETHIQLWNNLTAGKEWRGEFVNRRKDGSIYYESAIISPITGADGKVTHYLAVKEDISESRRIRQNILWQRDLAQALAGTTSIHAALKMCLERILESANLDCGGIYLAERASGDFKLIVSQGLSEEFVQSTARVQAGSPRWQMIMAGKAFYSPYEQIRISNAPAVINEGLCAFGMIPLLHEGRSIACFSIASHKLGEIAPEDREMIEEVAPQVGNMLVRIQAQEDLQQSHDELLASEARFRSLFEQTHDAVFMIDLEGHYQAANQRAADLYGYSIDEIMGFSVNDTSNEIDQNHNTLARLLAGENIPLFERLIQRKNGELLSVEINVELVRDKNGNPLHIQSVVRDISPRKQAEAALRQSEAKYRIVADNTYDWEFWADPAGNYIYISPSCKDVSGYDASELMTNPDLARMLVHPDDRSLMDRHNETVKNQVKAEIDFRIIAKDGSLRWISHICTPIFDENGVYLGNRGSNHDITRRKLAEDELVETNRKLNEQLVLVNQLKEQMREQTLHDPMTGMHNRRYLVDTLPREILRAGREQSCVSMIMADIDYFKNINDTYGHVSGDEILKVVAGFIMSNLRGSDIACRYGGEEFLLVLPGASLEATRKRAELLRKMCAETIFQYKDQEIQLTLSFGVASYPDHGSDPEEVIIKADKALYNSKNSGRNRVTVWDEKQPFETYAPGGRSIYHESEISSIE